MEADFTSHHIEGYARAAMEAGKDGHFRAPLVSHIWDAPSGGSLHMGGCIDGVRLSDDFDLVVSLYPWEKYELGPTTERVEIKLYDAAEVPDEVELAKAAFLVATSILAGKKVLVHCQAGLNRSGLISALALMAFDFEPADSIALLRERRHPVVLCNETFEQWLLTR
jgi:hypothetical protein